MGRPDPERICADAAALRSSLEIDFGLQLPDSPELAAALERLSRTPPEPGS
jgi:hypothetical protein